METIRYKKVLALKFNDFKTRQPERLTSQILKVRKELEKRGVIPAEVESAIFKDGDDFVTNKVTLVFQWFILKPIKTKHNERKTSQNDKPIRIEPNSICKKDWLFTG